MVHVTNLKADDARVPLAGPVSPWPVPTVRSSGSGGISRHRLGTLAGSAKLLKATTVSAGEGS